MQLLLEREGDLLAAYDIGKKLLEKNKKLEERVDELETLQEEMELEREKQASRPPKQSTSESDKERDDELVRLREQLDAAKAAEAKIQVQSAMTVAAVNDMSEQIQSQTDEIKSLEQQLLLAHQAMHENEREREAAERQLAEYQERCRALEEALQSSEESREQEVADAQEWARREVAQNGDDARKRLQEQLEEMEGRLARTMTAAGEDMAALEQHLQAVNSKLVEVSCFCVKAPTACCF